MRNLILIGMPGCGKSAVGRLLAARLNRPFYDADEEIEKELGCDIPTVFAERGEAAFRAAETKVLERLSRESGCVIATGGGCVTRVENYPLLRQNATVVWLRRPLDRLPKNGRPISQSIDISALYEVRAPLYERFCDFAADNGGTPEEAVEAILNGGNPK